MALLFLLHPCPRRAAHLDELPLDVGVEARAALGLLEHLTDLVEHGVRPKDLVADLAAQQDLLLVLRGKRLAKAVISL